MFSKDCINHLTINKNIKTLQHNYSTWQQLYAFCRVFYDYFQIKYVAKPVFYDRRNKYIALKTIIFWQIYVASGGGYTLP